MYGSFVVCIPEERTFNSVVEDIKDIMKRTYKLWTHDDSTNVDEALYREKRRQYLELVESLQDKVTELKNWDTIFRQKEKELGDLKRDLQELKQKKVIQLINNPYLYRLTGFCHLIQIVSFTWRSF
jgi:hypothetical protein